MNESLTVLEPPDMDARARLAPMLLEAWRVIVRLKNALAEAEADRDSYRMIAQQAIHALADLTKRHERQTTRLCELLEKQRRVR